MLAEADSFLGGKMATENHGPNGENCPACYFFDSCANDKSRSAQEVQEEEGYAGFCLRFPPSLMSEAWGSDNSPRVNCDDWCGEFKPRANP